MCGLCGVAGKGMWSSDKNAFQTLLYLSAIRGTHSTGVYAVNSTTGKGEVRKTLGPPVRFLTQEGVRKEESQIYNSVRPDILMGHCRDATVGQITLENAHPFDVGTIVGAHNGTFSSQRWRDLVKETGKTDSELLFEAIQKDGLKQTLESVNSWDAYAISLYDKKKKLLYLARNDQRPLYVGFLRGWGTIFWASKVEMLKLVATKSNQLEYMETFEVQPDMIYEIDPSDMPTKGVPWYTTRLVPKTVYSVPKKGSDASKKSRIVYPELKDKPEVKTQNVEDVKTENELLDDVVPEFLKKSVSTPSTHDVQSSDDRFDSCAHCGRPMANHYPVSIGPGIEVCSTCVSKHGIPELRRSLGVKGAA